MYLFSVDAFSFSINPTPPRFADSNTGLTYTIVRNASHKRYSLHVDTFSRIIGISKISAGTVSGKVPQSKKGIRSQLWEVKI